MRLATGTALASPVYLIRVRWTMNLLSAVHQLAWTQHPTIWLCESCAILWLVIRAVHSPWVRAGVLLMLCGLMLNGVVTAANAGTMPVVGMPSTLHPASPMWRVATSKTRLPFLADQARFGLFSAGDLMMLFGGILIVAICLHRGRSNLRKAVMDCVRKTSSGSALASPAAAYRRSLANSSQRLG